MENTAIPQSINLLERKKLIGEKRMQVIRRSARGIAMASFRKTFNWTIDQMEECLIDWVFSNQKITLNDYLVSRHQAQITSSQVI